MKQEKQESKSNTRFRITIEPVGFLLITSAVIQGIVHENSYITKVCLVNFQLNASLCSPRNESLDNNATESDEEVMRDRVQSHVSMLLIWSSLIETLPSIVFVLFLGPWSNKNGRKPLMVYPVVGFASSVLIYMLVNYVEWLPAEYLLLGSIPVGMMGGLNTLMMAINSYLVDITEERTRTLRLSIFSGMMMCSVPVASYVSVHIYQFGGVWAVWSTSFGLLITALFYLIFFVTESRGHQPANDVKPANKDQYSDKCHGVNILNSLVQCFVVTFRRRSGYERLRLILMLVMLCLSSFSLASAGMEYLYARKKFAWDAPDFAMFGVVASTIPAIGSLFVMPILSGFFGIHDWVIGIASLLGRIAAYLTIAFAQDSHTFYLSSLGNLLISGIDIVVNSSISKIVGIEDLGYVYSVTAGLSAVMPLVSSATAKLIYVATLNIFPGCVFVFGACLGLIMLTLSMLAFCLQNLDEKRCDPVLPVTAISFKLKEKPQAT